MRPLDEDNLRAYLDGELSSPERARIEQLLAGSPPVQKRLEKLRLERSQVSGRLDYLVPPRAAHSPARAAWRQFQARLHSDQQNLPPENESAPTGPSVWESPPLLAELKSLWQDHRPPQPSLSEKETGMRKKFVLASLVSLILIGLVIAVNLRPPGYFGEPVDFTIESAEGPAVMVNPQPTEEILTTSVLVALQPISRGTAFTPGSIGRRDWPSDNLPADLIEAESAVMGRIARTDIVQGQVIVSEMILDPVVSDTFELPENRMISALFDGKIELIGYRLEQADQVNLTLYWRARQPIEKDYTVFIHAMREDEILGQRDSIPVQGLAPTRAWQPGEIIVDTYDLQPMAANFPPGSVDLVVGLYNFETGQRLPVQSQDLPVRFESSVVLAQLQAGQTGPAAGRGILADAQGDTQTNIDHLKTLGLGWVELEMPWKEVELEPGQYRWEKWDDLIGAYAANDILILLKVANAPDWARPADDDKSVDGFPRDPGTYADFVAEVTERYALRVQAIEVWHWPNFWHEAGGRGRMDASVYVELLKQAYQTIKTTNAQMLVVSGAMTPAGNVGDLAIDDMDYLEQMYALGASNYFDALGANPSGYNCPALADWRTVTAEEADADPRHGTFSNRHHSWCFLGTMEGYRAIMVANGDQNKQIWPIEFGWAVTYSTDPGYEFARDNSHEEQARWIVEAYQWGSQQDWVGPMFLANLDFRIYSDWRAPYSIVGQPAYDALATLNADASDGNPAVVEPGSVAFELSSVRQLTPCENKGRRLLLIKVVDPTGQGLNDVPVKIQWGPEANDLALVHTETIDDEPGRIAFEMTGEASYSVEVQGGASQAANGLTTEFAAEEPCTGGGPGNKPGYISYEVTFRQAE